MKNEQAEPVAWRDHVEQRLHNWRQRTMNRSGDRLALDDMMSKESIDDLIDYVCDEWSDPTAPIIAPQERYRNSDIDPQQAEPVWVRPDQLQKARQAPFLCRVSPTKDALDLAPLYLHPPAAPQQAEPVAQIGWADEFGNLFPMGAWKPAQRTHHDSHKAAWRPVFLHPPAAEVQQAEPVGYFVNDESDDQWHQVDYEQRNGADTYPLYLHPPAAEVQRLRIALEQIELEANQPYIQRIAAEALALTTPK